MPNSYTQKVADGETDFRAFIMDCSRGFDFTSNREEDDLTDYEENGIAKAHAEITRFEAMTDRDAELAAQVDYWRSLAAWKRLSTHNALIAQRYNDMTERVLRWQAPEELEGMKRRILEWLRDSKRIDCSIYDRPELESGMSYRERHLTRAREDLIYYRGKLRDHIERLERREHLRDLLIQSLDEAETANARTADAK